MAGRRSSLRVVKIIVRQNARGVAVRVVELAGSKRPKERGKAGTAEQQRNRQQENERAHAGASVRDRRKAFSVTMIDDPDIATAAISGVTRPAAANGVARAL